MKRKTGTTLAMLLLTVATVTYGPSISLRARAAELEKLTPVTITGYCLRGTMANGEETHEGACAYRREDIGKLADVYTADGELIGTFKICDTGKKGGRIRQGLTIDIWRPTKEECYQLTQSGYIEVREAPEEGEQRNAVE